MPAPDGTEPVADDELLYRRVPASTNWYDPKVDPYLSAEAFRPTRNDTTGLSVYREKYMSIEEAAKGHPDRRYYVAVVRAGDLRACGIEIVARPKEGDPGHTELPGLTYKNRKTNEVLEWKRLLAEQLCIRVEGPFPQ